MKKISVLALGETVFTKLDSRTFLPAMEGVGAAPVVGDFTKGAHGTLIRLDAGVRLPLHHYTAPLTGIVISGAVAHPVPGNAKTNDTLGPGDVFSFAKDEPHETNNMSDDEPALFFIFQDSPWVFELD
ncbi:MULTISPECIES: cupin domain-containing protein [Pseudomonadota]|uniref:Cupin n=3 Tax=Pseudomonadota TaxID=1224 RepID=A0A8E0WP97_9SPHN|nr:MULTISPECIES: hypothetical protein [Pseudomonadota]EPR14817.1 hypothetical protein M527_27850 [Sphingobium indicum IP26]HCQ8620623.1 hypothetical protein [Klebsiella pneumoniae]HDW3841171.1 hypothetical protein [Raoultella ornithinolytica]EPR14826.1 hypothetical protein M527_27315 [Sphingobium indicum IP26]EPR18165.1 hypothetical protein M527_13620 [Sphingobium indicum IP26]